MLLGEHIDFHVCLSADDVDVFGIEFKADVVATPPMRTASSRTAAHERVEHDTAFRTACEYARANQLFGIYCEVSRQVRQDIDRPHIALIPDVANVVAVFRFACPRFPSLEAFAFVVVVTVWIDAVRTTAPLVVLSFLVGTWFAYLLIVEVVLLRLREQEDVFVCLGAAVFHWLRHGVRLVPDDVLPQIPTGIA